MIKEQIEEIVRHALEEYLHSSSLLVGYFIPAPDVGGVVRTITDEICDRVIFPELDFGRVITEALLTPRALRSQSRQDLGAIVAEYLQKMMKG